MAFLQFLFAAWFVGVFCSWPVFWFKKTDRSQAPIVRRLMGLAFALVWPYFVVAHFMNMQSRTDKELERQKAEDRILSGWDDVQRTNLPPARPSDAVERPTPPNSRISNPFD